jgi:hypothetical protein
LLSRPNNALIVAEENAAGGTRQLEKRDYQSRFSSCLGLIRAREALDAGTA